MTIDILKTKYFTTDSRRARFDKERKYGHWDGKTVRKVGNPQYHYFESMNAGKGLIKKFETSGAGLQEIYSQYYDDLLTQLDRDFGNDWIEKLPKKITKNDNIVRELFEAYGNKVHLSVKHGMANGESRINPAIRTTFYLCDAIRTEEEIDEIYHKKEKNDGVLNYLFGPIPFGELVFDRERRGFSGSRYEARHAAIFTNSNPDLNWLAAERHEYYLQDGESAEHYIKRRKWPIYSKNLNHVQMDHAYKSVHRSSPEAESRGQMLVGKFINMKTKDNKLPSSAYCWEPQEYFDNKLHNLGKGFCEIDFGKTVRVAHLATQGQYPTLRTYTRSEKNLQGQSQFVNSYSFLGFTGQDMTKGDFENWVTSYSVYGRYEKVPHGPRTEWFHIGTFSGNSDMFTEVSHALSVPLDIRYLRFEPKSHHGSHCRMRVAVYGEQIDKDDKEIDNGTREGMVIYSIRSAAENLGQRRGPCHYRLPKSDFLPYSHPVDYRETIARQNIEWRIGSPMLPYSRKEYINYGLASLKDEELEDKAIAGEVSDYCCDHCHAVIFPFCRIKTWDWRGYDIDKEDEYDDTRRIKISDLIPDNDVHKKLSRNQMKKQNRKLRQNNAKETSLTSWNILERDVSAQTDKSWILNFDITQQSESDDGSWDVVETP